MKIMWRRAKLLKISVFVLVFCLLFWLGNRYVIPHVERNVAEDVFPVSGEEHSEPVITIEQKEMGQDNDKITYFVSDILLSDATDLRTAFAKNQYGLNVKETLTEMAEAHGAVFAVNGDFYGWREDGIVIRNGVLYRDEPTGRECLVMYRDGSGEVMREGSMTGEELIEQGAWNVFSFGPVLVEDGKVREGLDKNYSVDGLSSDISGKEPRTGIGIIAKNHILIVTVDGRNEGYSCGMTFEELAQVFASYGCETAYNLDGGGSVTLYQQGNILNRPSKGSERDISDIIYIGGSTP